MGDDVSLFLRLTTQHHETTTMETIMKGLQNRASSTYLRPPSISYHEIIPYFIYQSVFLIGLSLALPSSLSCGRLIPIAFNMFPAGPAAPACPLKAASMF
jgi:hypothetical protein